MLAVPDGSGSYFTVIKADVSIALKLGDSKK